MELAREKAQSGPACRARVAPITCAPPHPRADAGGARRPRPRRSARGRRPRRLDPRDRRRLLLSPSAQHLNNLGFRRIIVSRMRSPRRLIAMLAPAAAAGVPGAGLGLPDPGARSADAGLARRPDLRRRRRRRSRAAWNAAHDRIITTVDLTVVDCWKGAAAPATHLQVVQPGGTVGEIEMRVDGMPHFRVGRADAALSAPARRARPRQRRRDGAGEAPGDPRGRVRPLDGERARPRRRRLRAHHPGVGRGLHGAPARAR